LPFVLRPASIGTVSVVLGIILAFFEGLTNAVSRIKSAATNRIDIAFFVASCATTADSENERNSHARICIRGAA
jgi:hypothetical protein